MSLLIQAAVAAVFIFLGQAGTTVKGAYDVLVSMSIIGYFIPYLFMFASMIKLQSRAGRPRGDAGAGRAARWRHCSAASDSASPAAAIGLALIPAEDEANKVLAVTKVAGLTAAAAARRGGGLSHGKGGRRSVTRSLRRSRRRALAGRARAHRGDGVLYFGFILLVAYGRALLARPGRARAHPRHPAGRAGDRRLLDPHLGLRALGDHALRPGHPGARIGSAGRDPGAGDHRDRRAQRRRDAVLLRLHLDHAGHHLVGRAAHPHHRAVLRRRAAPSARARTGSRWRATT